MVFANLSSHEKTAFFSLLDEYFASRPEVFSSGAPSAASPADRHGEDVASAALHNAGSAVHRALASNPEAASKLISAGLKHGVPKSSPYSAAAADSETRDAVSRVAAASIAFSAPSSNASSGFGQKLKPPPPAAPARRTPSSASARSGVDTGRGDVDTTRTDVSSARSLFESLRNPGGHPETSATSPAPSSFAAKKSAFAAPPMRRAPSSSSSAPPAPPPRRQQQQQPEEEEEEEEEAVEEEEQGEWAEALYDFASAESTDLELQAKQRVLVVEKTSEDWWTGEVDGRRGLFPASYVKLV